MRQISRLMIAAVLLCLATSVTGQDRQQPYRKGDAGITMPVVTKDVHPRYPEAAMKAKIAGTIEMQAVVLEDGTVGEVTVTKSLDTEYGLDDAAVSALKIVDLPTFGRPTIPTDKPMSFSCSSRALNGGGFSVIPSDE